MSVQRANYSRNFNSYCPIVLNSADSILSFKSASNVYVRNNVNSSVAICLPTDASLAYVLQGKVNSGCGCSPEDSIGVQYNY